MAGKLYIFCGEDEFSSREELELLKKDLGPREALDPNTTTLNGSAVSFSQLEMVCHTVPFLADWRLVIVDGLLTRLGLEGNRSPPARTVKRQKSPRLNEWDGLAAMISAAPETTVVVLLGGKLNTKAKLFGQLRSMGLVREFPRMQGQKLTRWVEERLRKRQGKISEEGVRFLLDYCAGDLRRLDSEIEKLCVYAGGAKISESDVAALVSDARQVNIFALVDAMVEGRRNDALRDLRQVMDSGGSGPYMVTMLARQVRMMVQAKAMGASRASIAEVGRAIGTSSDFVVRKTIEQARGYTWGKLMALLRGLLDVDIAIKTGGLDSGLALETLVSDLTVGSG